MKTQLKDIYGRRLTPAVRIFVLVAVIFFGLHIVFNGSSENSNEPAQKTRVE